MQCMAGMHARGNTISLTWAMGHDVAEYWMSLIYIHSVFCPEVKLSLKQLQH